MNADDLTEMDRMVLAEDGRRETPATNPGDGKKKENMTDKLIKVGMDGGKLFHDTDRTGYLAVSNKGKGVTIFRTDGGELKSLLAERYFSQYGRAASDKSMKESTGVLNGLAVFRGEEIPLSNRVAWRGENIVYDMSNEQREEVKIGVGGWKVHNSTIPSFKRWAHQSGQARPATGGDINDIFKVINVVEKDRLMTLVHIVASLVPDIPHPFIVLGGEQGSAKSSASRMFKSLIDPSVIEVASMPGKEDTMHQILSKHWYLIFDNVSWIQDWQSDAFCRAVTGMADSARKLYTDADDHIFKYKMCMGLNGITSLVSRPDLLERAVVLELAPIDDSRRRSEKDINATFEEMKPGMLGAMFDVLGRAMGIYEMVKLDSMPRMADFARWGCAISEALGYTQDDFMVAYRQKITESNEDAIDATPVAGLIIELMADIPRWEGTASNLYDALRGIVQGKDMSVRDFKGMKSPDSLGKAFGRISPNLRRVGINWSKMERSSKKRGYIIKKHDTSKLMTLDDTCSLYVIPSENKGDKGGMVKHIENKCHNVSSSVIAEGESQQQSERWNPDATAKDYDDETAEAIRAVLKSNLLDGCDVEYISKTTGISPATIDKHLTSNRLNVEKVGNGCYRMRG